jgi:archaetidylinositol phosphate synthase
MLDLKREKFKWLEKKIGFIFSHLPLSPNQYSLISPFFAFISFYFLIKQNLILAIFFFLIASFLDFIDGAVAKYQNIESKKGAFLETICDRYVEGILLFGMLFLPLPKVFLKSEIWIFLILFGSLLTTYVKSAAKEKELTKEELKGGILSRGERIILLIFSLILGKLINFYWLVYLLIILAILTNFTALQRIYLALKRGGI